jgi:hypothetical protein
MMLAKDRRRQPSLKRPTPHSERSETIGSRSARVLLGHTATASVRSKEQALARAAYATLGKKRLMLASLEKTKTLILAPLEAQTPTTHLDSLYQIPLHIPRPPLLCRHYSGLTTDFRVSGRNIEDLSWLIPWRRWCRWL